MAAWARQLRINGSLTISSMLIEEQMLSSQGISVTVYKCDGGHRDWSPEEQVTDFALVLVRSGSFRRRVDGTEMLAEPLVGYFERPGSAHQVAHPIGGDVCTAIGFSERTIESMIDPSQLPSGSPLYIEPEDDLIHRLLLMRLRGSAELGELVESTLALAGRVLRRGTSRGDARSAPTSYRRIANQVREALSDQPNLDLQDISVLLDRSMYHVSRAFKSATGFTISQYRLRVRARLALDRMECGESNLARLASDCGFADQAHMTRVLRREIKITPLRLMKIVAGTQSKDKN